MKLFCIGCHSDKVCHSLNNIYISFWLITLILNINCPLLCFSDDDTLLPTVPVKNSSQSSIEVASIHWNLTATETVAERLDMEPTVADNELTVINMKPDINYSNSLGSELMSG